MLPNFLGLQVFYIIVSEGDFHVSPIKYLAPVILIDNQKLPGDKVLTQKRGIATRFPTMLTIE